MTRTKRTLSAEEKMSEGERAFQTFWNQIAPNWMRNLDKCEPVYGYRFDEKRKWEFDVAWPVAKVAVEIEGGEFTGGRHVQGQGYQNDCTKYNAALVQGWLILRYTLIMLQRNPELAIQQIEALLFQETNE